MDKAPAYGAKDCRFESCLSQIFKIFSDKFSKIDEKEFDSGRTRTYNLLLRRQAPYPLGHRAVVSLWSNFLFFPCTMLCQFEALGSERFSIIISKNRIFNHVMAIRMITWISFIRRREFRNARGIFNQCNRYFCTWKSNVLSYIISVHANRNLFPYRPT